MRNIHLEISNKASTEINVFYEDYYCEQGMKSRD